jgi:hypothetical protein
MRPIRKLLGSDSHGQSQKPELCTAMALEEVYMRMVAPTDRPKWMMFWPDYDRTETISNCNVSWQLTCKHSNHELHIPWTSGGCRQIGSNQDKLLGVLLYNPESLRQATPACLVHVH